MKRFFLIDKENVGNRFLLGVNKLTIEDTLIVFHHELAGPIGEGVLNILNNSKASIEIIKMKTHTKNAMDFQICTYLGFLVSKYSSAATYYIVSGDCGYKASIELIKSQLDCDIEIHQIEDCKVDGISNIIPMAIGKSYSQDTIRVIKTGLKATSSTKDFHIYLQRTLKDDGPVIYNLIRPIYKEAIEEVAV